MDMDSTDEDSDEFSDEDDEDDDLGEDGEDGEDEVEEADPDGVEEDGGGDDEGDDEGKRRCAHCQAPHDVCSHAPCGCGLLAEGAAPPVLDAEELRDVQRPEDEDEFADLFAAAMGESLDSRRNVPKVSADNMKIPMHLMRGRSHADMQNGAVAFTMLKRKKAAGAGKVETTKVRPRLVMFKSPQLRVLILFLLCVFGVAFSICSLWSPKASALRTFLSKLR